MLSMGRACIVGYWRNPTWIPQVSPIGGGWRGGTGRERKGRGGTSDRVAKKFGKVNLTAKPQEITGGVRKFSVRSDVQCVQVDACKCVQMCVCARARAEERAFAGPGQKVT